MIAKNTERFEMRMDPETLDNLDNWRSDQSDLPSRAEAIRRLVGEGLSRTSNKYLTMTPAEILNVSLLCDIHQNMGNEGELDSAFIKEALYGGHYWALNWKYTGLFHGDEDTPEAVHEVVAILDMWSFIESGYDNLSKKDKEKVKQEAKPFGENVKFRGFDGNNETEHMSIAMFLIDEMGRFSEFKGRGMNSHAYSLGTYMRMLEIFASMKKGMIGQGLSASQIIAILKE